MTAIRIAGRHLLIAIFLNLFSSIFAELRFDPAPSPSELLIAADSNAIRKELPDFQRPDFKQIPYLIQRVNVDSGITEYLLPPEEPGQVTAKVAFRRKFLDSHLSVLIFPTGFYRWQKPVDRKYVVLRRHSKKTPVYFLTFAYVRQVGMERIIEWTVEDLERKPRKPEMEYEICRAEECDLPEWIVGSCPIVNHKCTIQLQNVENESINHPFKSEEHDFDWRSTFGDSSGSSEDMTSNHHNKFKRSIGFYPYGLDPDGEKIPNSYDLLEHEWLLVEHRENARRVRRFTDEHTVEEIMHILKCRNCQKLGNFYEDLEEEVTFNRILGEKFASVYNNTMPRHWRRFPWMRRATDLPYVGYGDCAYMSLQPDLKKPVSNEMDDVIEFYLDTLRLDCNKVLKNEIRGWLTSKIRFLRIVQDLSFELIPTSIMLQHKMLTPQEFETLISAILFLKYSAVYRETVANKAAYQLNLLGHPLSSKVSFLSRMFIKVIDLANRHLRHHMVKVSRALARTLKDKFYSLLLEKQFIRFKKTRKQDHLRKENYRDRIQIMALKEFLLYGLSPIFRSGTSTEVAFNSFYQLNENRIRFLVHSYGFDTSPEAED